jgi:succinate dehydrogenase/fumarate reductase-like Fe-S protein
MTKPSQNVTGRSQLNLTVDSISVTVASGSTVAVALAACPQSHARTSVSGQPRAVFCGMGVCQECRVSIDGVRRLACQTLCQPGMQVLRQP